MVSPLARDLALMKRAWWGAITSHWTGARFSGLLIDNLRLSRLRARPVNSNVMPRRFLKNWERAMLELVVEVATNARDETRVRL